jgi:hypothetical protein
MQLECPHCHAVLRLPDSPPKFCAYCGQRLPGTRADAAPRADTQPDDDVVDLPAPEERDRAPAFIGGYRLLRPLGSGGMGAVYEAEEASGRRVALKLIGAEYGESPDAVQRFRREGVLASTIDHPRCVFVLAADQEAGRPYLAMELMPGETLEDLVEREGRLPPEQAVAKILDVIDGLEEAHRCGILHRDVKPSNCFLEPDGRVKIGDFGLSKSLAADAKLTHSGLFVGTPLYASPEAIRRDPVDAQSDLYSVAATLYYLLTGRAPFQTGDLAATLARIVSDPAPSMRTIRPEIPATLDRVVLRGLERDRRRRWKSLEEFRKALLPYNPQPASPAFRLAAFLLDMPFMALLVGAFRRIILWEFVPVEYDPETGRVLWETSLPDLLSIIVLLMLYYVPLEGFWGCTLGQRLMRLRVCRTHSPRRPGLLRASLRALLVITTWLLTVLILGWVSSFIQLLLMALLRTYLEYRKLPWGVEAGIASLEWLLNYHYVLVPVVLPFVFWRWSGRRGPHEWLSGTRTVRLPVGRPGRLLALPPQYEVSRPAGLPDRIGPFVVRGVLSVQGESHLLEGEDPALQRRVWIWLRPSAGPFVSAARQTVGRRTRQRWLAAGRHGEEIWDAFLAPAGSPLPRIIAHHGRLSWSQAVLLLSQLAEEVAEATREGSLPRTLKVEQVWVQPNGRAQLLDVCPDGEWAAGSGEAADRASQALIVLRQVAVLLLEGNPGQADAGGRPIRAPVPVSAGRVLNRLMGLQDSYPSIEALQSDLAELRDAPTEVTRGQRLAQGALSLVMHFLGVLSVFVGTFALYGSALILGGGSWPGLDRAATALGGREFILILCGLALLWVLLTRGGLALRLAGLCLLGPDGTAASRARCAGRAVLLYAPFFVLAWTDMLTEYTCLGILLVYAALGLWSPGRTLHDRLAGTWLVPR